MNIVASKAVIPAAIALAIWPVLIWYVSATMDASNDYWGLLALVTALVVVARNKSAVAVRFPLLLPAAFIALYALATLSAAPISVRAALCLLALGSLACAWRMGKRVDLPLFALLMLALPLAATFQFYLGYPLRVIAGALSAALLQMNGIAVVREGALLNWAGQAIAIDAPCSGVKMLWAAMYLVYTLSAFHRLSFVKTSCAIVLAVVTVVIANSIRAAALFYVETGMLNVPRWGHETIGMLCFATGACAILWGIHTIKGRADMVNYGTRWFLIVCLLAALAPLVAGGKSGVATGSSGFPGWPATFENKALTQLPLSKLEQRFAQDFPGRIARFTDGNREIIMRWVAHPTRKLHPAVDCFLANGYKVTLRPIRGTGGERWATFFASHGKNNYLVSERIHDQNGRQWSDVSAWYWENRTGGTDAAWAVTVAQKY